MKSKHIVYVLIILVLVAGFSFAGWKYSLAQGVESSEPDGRIIGNDTAITKEKAPSSATTNITQPSEGNAILGSNNETGEKLMVMNISADGQATLSEQPESILGSDPTKLRSVLPSPAELNIPQALFPSHWFGVLAAAFSPSDSAITYNYGGVGCVHALVAGQWRAAVNLPDGAVAKYIYFQFYNPNNTVGSSTLWLTRYRWDGAYNDLISAVSLPGSSGTGYRYVSSPEITTNNVIDNFNYVYGFVWSGSTTQYFCSTQVGYYPPGSSASLPFITK
jgi:hypothetical protein